MVEQKLPKLTTRVRFPSPAPAPGFPSSPRSAPSSCGARSPRSALALAPAAVPADRTALAIGALPGLLHVRAWRVPLRTLALGIGGLFGFHFLLFLALRLAPPLEANLVTTCGRC